MVPDWLHSPCQPPQWEAFPGSGASFSYFFGSLCRYMGKSGWSPLSVSDYSLNTVGQHFYSVLTTQWGMLDILWFGVPGSHQCEGQFPPTFRSHITSVLCTRFPSQRCPMSNATSNPLYFLLLCQYHQFTGEVSEAQQYERTAQDHPACYVTSVDSRFLVYWPSCSFIKHLLNSKLNSPRIRHYHTLVWEAEW